MREKIKGIFNRILNAENETKTVKNNFIFIMVTLGVLFLCNAGIGIGIILIDKAVADEEFVLTFFVGRLAELLLGVLVVVLTVCIIVLLTLSLVAKAIFKKTPKSILAYRILMGLVFGILGILEITFLKIEVKLQQVFGMLLAVVIIGVTIYHIINTYSHKICEEW